MADAKRRVLFLCTGNSCRSHMGEGLLRSLADDRFESLSAGSHPAGYVHPVTIEVMAEIDIDVKKHASKDVRQYLPPEGTPPHVIISVCHSADRSCPAFPGDDRRLRWPLVDPAAIADPVEQLKLARRVRDDLRERLVKAIENGELE